MPITRYDRSPLEQAVLERDRFQDEVARLRADLQLHREALEKARVGLEMSYVYVTAKSRWIDLAPLSQAISTINDLLDKEGGQK